MSFALILDYLSLIFLLSYQRPISKSEIFRLSCFFLRGKMDFFFFEGGWRANSFPCVSLSVRARARVCVCARALHASMHVPKQRHIHPRHTRTHAQWHTHPNEHLHRNTCMYYLCTETCNLTRTPRLRRNTHTHRRPTNPPQPLPHSHPKRKQMWKGEGKGKKNPEKKSYKKEVK